MELRPQRRQARDQGASIVQLPSPAIAMKPAGSLVVHAELELRRVGQQGPQALGEIAPAMQLGRPATQIARHSRDLTGQSVEVAAIGLG